MSVKTFQCNNYQFISYFESKFIIKKNIIQSSMKIFESESASDSHCYGSVKFYIYCIIY